jgi:hypothetical protein
MKVSPKTEDAALKAAKRDLLEAGLHDGVLLAIEERRAKASGNDMLVPKIGIRDANGTERELIDYLTGSDRAASRLRHLCAACGAEVLAKYEAGSISASDFVVGQPLRVQVGVEKARKSYPARNVVEDYSAATASVVTLRAAG